MFLLFAVEFSSTYVLGVSLRFATDYAAIFDIRQLFVARDVRTRAFGAKYLEKKISVINN